MRLRAGDVHHQQRRPVGGDAPADGKALVAAVDPQRDAVRRAQLRARGSIDEDEIGVERGQRRDRRRLRAGRARRGRGLGLREPAGRDPRCHQRIEAQQVRGMRLPVAAAQADREIDHRTRLRDARRHRDARVKVFGQQAIARTHAEVGRAAGRMHRGLELRQRRCVDQLHRERQRDAQRHGHDRRRLSPGVMSPFRPQQLEVQRRHRQR